MTAFAYRAVDAMGRETRGMLEADTAKAARQALREKGLHPVEVGPFASGRAGRRKALGTASLSLLTRQWATLLLAGLTTEQAISALIDQAESEGVVALLTGVRSEIVAGFSLLSALDRFPEAFPALYRASVAAGEKAGRLPDVMLQLADYLERGAALRQKIVQAVAYPLLVATVALLVVSGLMVYVVPQVLSVFEHGRQELPWLTLGLLAVSRVASQFGPAAVLALTLAGAALGLALRRESFRRRFQSWLLRFPLIGRQWRTVDTTRFASTLAILVGSGVPLLAALEAGRQVLTLLPLRDAVADATDRVREGLPLSRALGRSRSFPPVLVHLISSGEATGQLAPMLERAARLQQAELESRSALLTTLLEPALLLAMGSFVLLLVLAVMQPLIEINSLFG